MGYCPDCIAGRLRAGSRITGFLPYDRFVGLEMAHPVAPGLSFTPRPYWCEG